MKVRNFRWFCAYVNVGYGCIDDWSLYDKIYTAFRLYIMKGY